MTVIIIIIIIIIITICRSSGRRTSNCRNTNLYLFIIPIGSLVFWLLVVIDFRVDVWLLLQVYDVNHLLVTLVKCNQVT